MGFLRKSCGTFVGASAFLTPMIALVGTLLAALSAPPATAQFALAVVPPRFELQAKPGQKLREVIELSNSETSAGRYSIKTNDWTLNPDASVAFSDDLATDSCRRWVAIERKEVNVFPNRPYRYRFEVNVPEDAKPQECRFAIMIEGQEQHTKSGAVALPFSARLGLIVYVVIGDAAPTLKVKSHRVVVRDKQAVAVLEVENTGKATGRLSGFLSGTDGTGEKLEFSPMATPILPGEVREIGFTATRLNDPNTPVTPVLPITISGKIEGLAADATEPSSATDKGKSASIERVFKKP